MKKILIATGIIFIVGCNNSSFLGQTGAGAGAEKEKNNWENVIKIYNEACNKGSNEDCNTLGILYDDGEVVKPDYGKAMKLYQKACDNNFFEACDNLILLEQTLFINSRMKSFEMYKKACDNGHFYDCDAVGHMYRINDVIKADYNMAIKYYEKACNNTNDILSCFNVGAIYSDKRDYDTAKKYYKKSCDKGFKTACNMYENPSSKDYIFAMTRFSNMGANSTTHQSYRKKRCDNGDKLSCRMYKKNGEIYFSGDATKIIDGDTIEIKVDYGEVPLVYKIRLWGIDAPEKGQAYGKESSTNLANLCAEEFIRVNIKGKDKYERILGIITCKGIEANRKQVQDGLAWAYSEYSKDYIDDELKAKESKLGLWQDNNPINPLVWRKQKPANY